MYVERIPNRQSPPAILLREAWRERGRVRKRTIANLTDWPAARIEALRRVLRDEPLVRADELFTVETSTPHGHVEAILGLVRRLGLDTLLATKRSRARDLVLAMIVERLIHPCSKLATTRLWSTTTLGESLGVSDADVDELYAALDWLLRRQPAIEQKLAARHLTDGGLVLYDVSSSYYEGRTCPLARFGHDRDGQTGLPIIVYGVLTDAGGCPVAVDVYAGNVGDPKTIPDQVDTLRERFGLAQVVLVGDRGMLTQTQIEHLQDLSGARVDLGVTQPRDSRVGGERSAPALALRRAAPRGDHGAGLSGRAPRRVLQSVAGGRTPAQARGPARGHRTRPREAGPGRGTAHAAAVR